jgi:hypothetical protein
LTAIETCNPHKAVEWIKLHSTDEDDDVLMPQPTMIQLISIANDCSGCFSVPDRIVPALLCRPLIHFRQKQISGIRANAARKEANDSFPVKQPVAEKQPGKTDKNLRR